MTSDKVLLDDLSNDPVSPERQQEIVNLVGDSGSSIRAGRGILKPVSEKTDQLLPQKFYQLSWIMTNFESILQQRRNVKPNNSPVLLFPNGKIRLPSMGTYPSIEDAYRALKRSSGDLSNETL